MAKLLDTFTIARSTEGYLLQFDDEDGDTHEFAMSYDQLELISEEIERHLDHDEADALATDEDDEIGEPDA